MITLSRSEVKEQVFLNLSCNVTVPTLVEGGYHVMVGFPIVKLSFHMYVNLVFKKKLYYLNNNEKHLILQKALVQSVFIFMKNHLLIKGET